MARPEKWKDEYTNIARKACQLGATDADLADMFEVSIRTIHHWKADKPEFADALKVGKDVADDVVERSLYQKAVGYTHDAIKIFMPANADAPVYAPYREHVAPDTTACIFWLKNRRRAEWRDKIDHEHGGVDGAAILTRLEVVGVVPERK